MNRPRLHSRAIRNGRVILLVGMAVGVVLCACSPAFAAVVWGGFEHATGVSFWPGGGGVSWRDYSPFDRSVVLTQQVPYDHPNELSVRVAGHQMILPLAGGAVLDALDLKLTGNGPGMHTGQEPQGDTVDTVCGSSAQLFTSFYATPSDDPQITEYFQIGGFYTLGGYITPGDSVWLSVKVRAPASPGNYWYYLYYEELIDTPGDFLRAAHSWSPTYQNYYQSIGLYYDLQVRIYRDPSSIGNDPRVVTRVWGSVAPVEPEEQRVRASDANYSQLSDSQDFTAFNGVGVRQPSQNVIPEPSAFAIWSLFAAAGITGAWWRRKRSFPG